MPSASFAEQLAERLAEKQQAAETQQTPEPETDAGLPEQDEPVRADDTPEPETAESEGDESEEASSIETLTDFARAAGWEPEDLYNLSMSLSDDGETLKLGDIKDKLQEYNRTQAEIEAKRAELQEHEKQLQQSYQAALSQAQQFSEGERQAMAKISMIENQYSSVNWDEFDEKDPGRSANLKQSLATQYAAAKHELEQAQQQAQQMRQHYQQQTLMQNQQKLMEEIPDWKDPQKREKDLPALRGFLGQHFSPDELRNLVDWRVVKLFRDAMLWQQHQEGQKAVEGKVRRATQRVMRPGGKMTESSRKDRIRKLREQARHAPKADRQRLAREALILGLGKDNG